MGIFQNGAYYPLGTGEELSEGEYELQYQMVQDAGERAPMTRTERRRFDAYAFHDNVYEYGSVAPWEEESPVVMRGDWRSKEGVVRIVDMTDSHLRNAIRFFERRGSGFDHMHDKIAELRAEATRRLLERAK